MQAGTEVDLSVVGNNAGDGGVPQGALLTALVDATLSFDSTAVADVGNRLLEQIGPAGLVDAAAVTAMFQLNTRAADAVGLPVEARSLADRDKIGVSLGFESRADGLAP
ncbi:MAG: hypothetical protein AAF529_15545 [Pseudomonadota bacterium]